MPFLFLFNLFLEARAEILKKILLVLGRFEDTKRTFRNLLTFRKRHDNAQQVKSRKNNAYETGGFDV